MQLIVANRMIFLSVLRDDSDSARAALERWQCRLPARSANRPQSSVAYALLFDLLSEVYGGMAETLQIDHEDSGRPFLRDESGLHGQMPFISISHSANWVGCVATRHGDIGLDLEMARPGRDVIGMADAAFGPTEVAEVRRVGAAAFYRIWSLREAQAKALGRGLAMVIDRQDHVPISPETGSWSTVNNGNRWSWLVDQPHENLHLAIAVREDQSVRPNHSTMQVQKCHVSSELAFGPSVQITL